LPIAKYCTTCGNGVVATAVICPNCGSSIASASGVAKSKTTSVLLAVFLGGWTWLYTYKKDAWKFWVGLGLGVLQALFYFAYLGARNSFDSNQNAYLGWWFIFLVGIHVWAIIDVSVKNESWYRSYPN
jgi:uncharacterized membrane protein YczE